MHQIPTCDPKLLEKKNWTNNSNGKNGFLSIAVGTSFSVLFLLTSLYLLYFMILQTMHQIQLWQRFMLFW